MKKNVKLGVGLLLSFLACNQLNARDFSLVEESSYGKDPYYDSVKTGSIVYASGSSDEIDIFDTVDPANIELINTVTADCEVYSLMVDNQTLVAGCPFAIHFYDIATPSQPELIGSYDSTSYAVNGIYLEGDRFYMAGGNSDILVFDASDLSNIVELGRETLSSFSTIRLHKTGDHLYFVEDFNRVNFYDVADPSNITKTSEYKTTGPSFYEATVVDDYLYIGMGIGLQVVDVSDKSSPTLIKNIIEDVFIGSFEPMRSINSNDNLLVAGSFNGDLYEFDITDRANPDFLGGIADATNSGIYNTFIDVDVDVVTVTAVGSISGVSTFDFSEPTAAVKLDNYSESILPRQLAATNNALLVSDESNLYHLFDLDSNNQLIPITQVMANGMPGHPSGKGDFAWLGGNRYLRTYDVGTPATPFMIDEQSVDETFASISYTKVVGDKLLVGTNKAEVMLYDISGVLPSLLTSINLGADTDNVNYYVAEIELLEDYLVVSSNGGNIFTIDISDYDSPAVVSENNWTNLNGFTVRTYIAGNYLYMGGGTGLLAADISDLSAPNFLGALEGFDGVGVYLIQEINSSQVIISDENGLHLVNVGSEGQLEVIHTLANYEPILELTNFKDKLVGSVAYESELKVLSINRAPVAEDLAIELDEDTNTSNVVSATDEEGDDVTFSLSTAATNGEVTIQSNGAFGYQPNPDYNGQDSFTFKAEDAHGGSSEGTVTITINPVNDAPTASNVSLTTTGDTAVSGSFNASDIDGDELTYEHTSPSNGTVSVSGSDFTYTPASGFSGQDSFQYTATDPSGESATATVTITVNKPASGGGSGDLWLLALLLSGFVLRRQVR